jgi:hydroxyacylglutathione hydrolase
MSLSVSPLEAGRLVREEDGVVLIDIRPAPEFTRGHPEGALSVPYSLQGMAARVRVADPAAVAVVLVSWDAAQAEGAGRQLAEAGWTVRGHADADDEAWSSAGLSWPALPERPVAALTGPADTVVVDVREPLEWDTGFVPGAILVPLGSLRDELGRIPRDREVVVICEAGIRSATGASILLKEGYTMVSHAPLGTAEVRRAGGPLAYPQPAVEGAI